MSSTHKQVFVSHSLSDNDFSRQLVNNLQQLGHTIWKGTREIPLMLRGMHYLGTPVGRRAGLSDRWLCGAQRACAAAGMTTRRHADRLSLDGQQRAPVERPCWQSAGHAQWPL
jgi:hypothetical protein